jgi:hypothetical protein
VEICVLFHDLDKITTVKLLHFKKPAGVGVEIINSNDIARIKMCKIMLAQSVL